MARRYRARFKRKSSSGFRRLVSVLVWVLILSGLSSSCAPVPTPTPTPLPVAAPAAELPTPAPVPVVVSRADRVPVFVTTDMSSDDVVAILYLLSHPGVEVLGIGSADGVAHVEPAARNVLRLLALVSREDIPVAVGSEESLEGDHAFPSGWRGGADRLFGLSTPDALTEPVQESTAELLADVINAHPREVTVVLLGAHTDLALALRSDPGLASRIKSVHMMGGAVNVPGNIHEEHAAIANESAEWNLWLDYSAAAMVFDTPIIKSVVPLDATNQVRVDRAYYERFAGKAESPAARLVAELWKSQASRSPSGFYIWDVVAAVALPFPDLAVWQAMGLSVVTDRPDDLGQTVDTGDGDSNSMVCLKVDVSRLQEELIRVLNQ